MATSVQTGVPSEWNLSLCSLAVKELQQSANGKTLRIVAHLESATDVRQYILNSDIRKLGSKTAGESGEEIHNKSNAMIDNVQRQIEKARLGAGGVLLQLIKISDISKPAAASATYESSKGSSGGGGGGKRVLLLQATDGTQKVSCLEVDRVDALSVGLPPGTKILLDGSTEVLNGQVLLRPDKVKVVGGTVERLVEAWKANKLAAESRFGSESRTKDASVDGPPKFVSFADRNKIYKRHNQKAPEVVMNKDLAPSEGPAPPSDDQPSSSRFNRGEVGEAAAVVDMAKVSKDAFKSKFDRAPTAARKPHMGKHTRRNEARALEAEYSRPSTGGASLGAFLNLGKSDELAAAMLLSEAAAVEPPKVTRESGKGKGKGRGRHDDDHNHGKGKGKGKGKGGKGGHRKGGGGGHKGGKGKGRW